MDRFLLNGFGGILARLMIRATGLRNNTGFLEFRPSPPETSIPRVVFHILSDSQVEDYEI